ncbi:MAG: aldo/keto reductase, partial [Microbacteriaceae bacterium]
LGFGAAQLGNLYRVTTDAEAEGAIDAAWAGGIRYFDTARHYGIGLSERRLGALLRRYPRDDYVVSTKVGRRLVPTPERAGEQDSDFVVPAETRREWDFSRDGILRTVEQSLAATGLDRVDILYLHDPDDHFDEAVATGMPTLIELRDQGVVGAIGAGMNQAAMLAEFVRRCDVDVMMVAGRYTLLDRSADEELLPLALERGVGIVAAGVYNSGLLSSPTVPDDAKLDYAPAPAEVIAEARRVAAICEQYGATLPDAAVQFALRHPAVVSVVLGTRTPAQAHSGVDRYSVPLGDDLWAAIDERGTR